MKSAAADLLPPYKQVIRQLEQARQAEEDKKRRRILSEMIGSCEFVAEWLGTGRQPGPRRGIERRSRQQREVLLEPEKINWFARGRVNYNSVTPEQQARIKAALSHLSDRERDCYIMHHGEGLPYSQIAELLGVRKGSVSTFMNRARKKLKQVTGRL
ncbi:sigma-70 family RNA polymerase sigma factor [Paenibacillus senegalensis]|uniref:sigma-70 family RNA polymerase sigma factor n=1 Tax=Paenibacillus senegalensis TaxID=1465766 RepID=UPI0002893E4A